MKNTTQEKKQDYNLTGSEEVKMTDKEKAIEALKAKYTGTNDKGDVLLAFTAEQVKTVSDYITQPTIDDAIAVVENMIHHLWFKKLHQDSSTMKDLYSLKINYVNEILTALKGLKEGK